MQYDFTLNPNGSQTLEVSGTYFTYKGGLGAIRVTPSSGDSVDLLPGQGMSAVKFDRLTIKDLSGAANAGAVLAGTGAWRDERIAGTVEVIDGARNRTLANQAFQGNTYCAGVAGQIPMCQLFNTDPTRRVIVTAVTTTQGTGGAVGIMIVSAAIGNPANTGMNGTRYPSSKLSGGVPAKAEMRVGNSASNPVGAALISNSVQPGIAQERRYTDPVILLAGYGLTVWYPGAGQDVTAGFEFIEEVI